MLNVRSLERVSAKKFFSMVKTKKKCTRFVDTISPYATAHFTRVSAALRITLRLWGCSIAAFFVPTKTMETKKIIQIKA